MREESRLALLEIADQVEAWAREQEAGGVYPNRALIYVAEAMSYALEVDPEGADRELMTLFDAAADFVDTYRSLLGEGAFPAEAEELQDRRFARLDEMQGFLEAEMADPSPLDLDLEETSQTLWLQFRRALELRSGLSVSQVLNAVLTS